MPELTEIVRHLPVNGPGRRLARGLGLRLSRGNGMMVLGCSRIGVRPSTTEMETVVDAVTAVFQPAAIFQADETERRLVLNQEHFIWRLYWPVESVSVVWRPAEQLALINEGVV
jgi:hypothetical protein